MERIVLSRLSTFLYENNLIHPDQFGFRKGHCTMDQVLHNSQIIRDDHNLRPTNHTVAAFLDLSNAFDRPGERNCLQIFQHFQNQGESSVLAC
ncbi:hypothetical protein TNCT_299371 [Trichonephila clavata]|uniref:Reverse transcriptase domain-containing protein n=1 Tax=Trichonephila clavata TaxID=2740835 RepID=A0A8X6LE22_TRICU|nr:hypothetical protein TNCT_299371 [Trichonephila clavata]